MRNTTGAKPETQDAGSVGKIKDKHLRILIVDDETSFRKALSFRLGRKYGARVQEAASGMQAVEAVKSGGLFDIILLDIIMPHMNGIATYQELKKLNTKSVIIIMSAYEGSKEWEEAKQLDLETLPKPIPEEKMTCILAHVANSLT